MAASSTHTSARPWYDSGRLAAMFVSAFLAVLIFHQGVLAILHGVGMVPVPAWRMSPTAPFGVPQVISLAFWGGVWGLVFSWAESRFPDGAGYWIAALLFGAIAPTLVAWFVAFPLHGRPVAAGFVPAHMVVGPLVNGAWGIGTALIYQIIARIMGWGRRAPAHPSG